MYKRSFADEDDSEVKDFVDLNNEPLSKSEWGRYGEYLLVGNGKVTSEKCGKFSGLKVCFNVHLHDVFTLDCVNYSGKVFYSKRFYNCHRPSCPVCFKRGWAVREASNIEARIQEASKKFGLAEHIIVGVPSVDYGLSYEKLRALAVRVLASRGVVGGVLIFHAFRYRNYYDSVRKGKPKGWYWSPHFHCIGFIEDGYGRCRNCNKSTLECLSCSGFEGRTRRLFDKEAKRNGSGVGWIVKVKGERKTIHGTAWYQLNHSSFVRGSVRARVTTWFGVCSYRKMKLYKGEKLHEDICPLCCRPLEDAVYVGKGDILKEWWLKEAWTDFLDEDGNPRFVLKPKKCSGNYE